MSSFKFFQIGRMSMALFVALIIAVTTFGFASPAKAETVTCTGTETTTNSYRVFYQKTTNSCTISNTSGGNLKDSIAFQFSTSSAGSLTFVFATADLTTSQTVHNSCAIGSFSAATGATCLTTRTTNGSETASASYTASDGSTLTMNVSYTIAGGGTDIDTTSASVTITPAASSTTSAFQALQASVSRSQSAVVGKNVGARLASAASPSGGANPSGTGDQEDSTSSFAHVFVFSAIESRSPTSRSRGATMRDIAMLASFDTSKMVLAAAGDEQDPLKGIQQRRAGLGDRPYTLWGHGSFTSVDNTRNRTGDDSRYDGDVWGYNMGLDYRFRPELVAGLSVGYSETDLTTTFNSGTYDETNWTVSPYAMYQPMDNVTLSAIAGYSFGDVDRTRDTTVTGNTDSGMWFASLNGSYKYTPSQDMPLDLTAKMAVLISRKTVDAFTESDGTAVAKSTSDTRQIKPGIEAAYSFDAQGTTLQPFAKADYVHDFTDETNGDKGAFNLGGGLRIASGETGLSGSIEGERQVGRDDYKEYTVSGLIAYNFGVGGDGTSKLGIASPYIKSNFNPDSGQMFGTGLKFTSDSGTFNTELNFTHTMPTAGTADTAGQIRAELKF